jgi:hypothetical protein
MRSTMTAQVFTGRGRDRERKRDGEEGRRLATAVLALHRSCGGELWQRPRWEGRREGLKCGGEGVARVALRGERRGAERVFFLDRYDNLSCSS